MLKIGKTENYTILYQRSTYILYGIKMCLKEIKIDALLLLFSINYFGNIFN